MKLGFIFFLLINFSGLFAQTADSISVGSNNTITTSSTCEVLILQLIQSSTTYKEMVAPFKNENIKYTLEFNNTYAYTFFIDNTETMNTIGNFNYDPKTKLLFQLDAAEGVDKEVSYDKAFTVNQNCN